MQTKGLRGLVELPRPWRGEGAAGIWFSKVLCAWSHLDVSKWLHEQALEGDHTAGISHWAFCWASSLKEVLSSHRDVQGGQVLTGRG